MHSFTKYFLEQNSYDRFIKKLYQKYKSIGRFSGKIKLESISKEEAISFSRLFGNSYDENDDVVFSIKKFILIMEKSKYTDFDICILVEEYLGIQLLTNREEKDVNLEEENLFYQNIVIHNNGLGSKWLNDVVVNRIPPYRIIHQRYNKNKIDLEKELSNIISCINNLPKEKMLISIYASRFTNDPHYLDLDTNHSNLFLHALSYIDNSLFPKTRDLKIKLLSKYNIEIDSISNFAITYNLLSNRNYINMFAKNKESLILNIQNIINVQSFDTKFKKVFILENPSILMEIMANKIDVGVIIADGFPNAGVHLLIEKLIETNNKLYYNGDFDPEGLLIAQKLKDRYGDNLILFGYDADSYYENLSVKEISDQRLSKLAKVKEKDLLEIRKLLYKNKKGSYQENNKDKLIISIKNIISYK